MFVEKGLKVKKARNYSMTARLTASILLTTFTSWLAAPYVALLPRAELRAQPLSIPNLNNQGFQSQDLDPYFNQAGTSLEQQNWETIIAGGISTVYAAWEAGVDAEINTYVATVNQAGNFNSLTEAQDYMRNMLVLQKQQQASAWTLAAEASINLQRTAFLNQLAADQKTATEAGTNKELKTAANRTASDTNRINTELTPEQQVDRELTSIEQGLANGRRAWERDFQDQLDIGLYQYQAAQNVLASDYQDITQTIDAKDAEFQTALQQMEVQQNQARAVVNTAITDLENFLAGFGMFHDASNNLTPGGNQLQTLIDSLKTGMQNGDPLSGLMTQVRDFLDAQQQHAVGQKQHWDGLANLPNQPYSRTFPQISDPQTPLDVNLINNVPDAGAAVQYYYSGQTETSAITSFLQTHTGYTITNINSVELRAVGSTHLAPNLLVSNHGVNEAFSTINGPYINVLYYDRCTPLGCGSLPEPELEVLFTYDASDPAAQANANLFDGYANALAAELTNWNDNILPGLQNWESAVNAYKADYQAWKTDADAKKAQARTAYDAGIQALSAERSQWLADMREQYRLGKKKWDAQQNKFTETKADLKESMLARISAGEKTDEVLRAESNRIVADLVENLPGGVPNLPNIGASLNGLRAKMPELRKEFLDRVSRNRPDASQLNNALEAFRKSTRAVMNLSMANAMDRHAREMRQGVINRARETAKAYGYTSVEVDDYGNVKATRAVHSGAATLKPNADPTSADSYEAEMVKQKLSFAPPPSLTLAGNTDLFASADPTALMNRFSNNVQAFNQRANENYETMRSNLDDAQTLATTRQAHYQNEVNRRVQEATLMKDLAETVLKGGTLSGWVQSQLQSRVAGAIGEATGIPTSIIAAVLGGSSLKDAVTGYAEGLIVQEIETATGIPGLGAHLLSEYKAKQARRNSATGKNANAMASAVTAGAMGMGFSMLTGGMSSMAALGGVGGGTIMAQAAAAAGFQSAVAGTAMGKFAHDNQEKLADYFYENPQAMKVTAIALGGAAGNIAFDTVDAYHRGGGLGVVASVANSALKVTNLVGADISISYDSENGWGGSIGAGIDLGIGKLGVSATFQEGQGMTGASVGLRNESLGLAAGLNWDKEAGFGAFVGMTSADGRASAGFGYSERDGASAYVGLGKQKLTYSQGAGLGFSIGGGNGQFGSASLSWTQRDGASVGINANLGALTGVSDLNSATAGLTWSERDGFGASVNASRGFRDPNSNRVIPGTRSSAAASGGFSISERGGFQASSSVTSGIDIPVINNMAALQGQMDTVIEARQSAAMDAERRELLVHMGVSAAQVTTMTAEQVQSELATRAQMERLARSSGLDADLTRGYNTSNSSRAEGDFLNNFIGGVADDLSSIGGRISDSNGYIDSNGAYHERVCFTGNTLVRTPHGRKAIQRIKPGEKVLSWNAQTGQVVEEIVQQTFVKKARKIFVITYDDGSRIETTWSHRFYIAGRGWVKAKDLKSENRSHTVNSIDKSSSLFVPGRQAKIVNIDIQDREETVYNFTVSTTNTYFVSDLDVLVHNDQYFTCAFGISCEKGQPRGVRIVSERYGDSKTIDLTNVHMVGGRIAFSSDDRNEVLMMPANGSSSGTDGSISRYSNDKFGNKIQYDVGTSLVTMSDKYQSAIINGREVADGGLIRMDARGRMHVVTRDGRDPSRIGRDIAGAGMGRNSIVYVNGQDNHFNDSITGLNATRTAAGNRTVYGVFNSSTGIPLVTDTRNSSVLISNPDSLAPAQLEPSLNTVTQLIRQERVGILIGHSQGGIITGNALRIADSVGSNIRRIQWLTFGGAQTHQNIPDKRMRNTVFTQNEDDPISVGVQPAADGKKTHFLKQKKVRRYGGDIVIGHGSGHSYATSYYKDVQIQLRKALKNLR